LGALFEGAKLCEAEEGCELLQRCFIPPLGCNVGPTADCAAEVGWMVVFNLPQSHQEAIPGERKGRTRSRTTRQRKKQYPSSPKNQRRSKRDGGKNMEAERPCGQRSEVTPSIPPSITTGGKGQAFPLQTRL